MSISWELFWFNGPLSSKRLQNSSTESLCRCDEAGGEHHEHQLGTFLVQWPPKLQTFGKPFRPSDCADVTRREASIMSISWELFWFNGPLSSKRLQNPFDRVIVQM